MRYSEARSYWDGIFSQSQPFNAHQPLPSPLLEEALTWLCEGAPNVLDFGCGVGRALFRCVELGAASVTGIDMSNAAIRLAQTVARTNDLAGRCAFRLGSIETLEELPPESFQAAVLFNVLDNLMPEDARRVIRAVECALGPGGRLVVKLNACLTAEELIGYKPLGPDLFRQNTGLLQWNIPDHELPELLEPGFELIKSEQVRLGTNGAWNRLLLAEKRALN